MHILKCSFNSLVAGLALLSAGPFSAAMAQAPAAQKPNIVFLISDDHRWDALGVANPQIKTPNLDKMAEEGQWHKEFTIQISTCTASRAAILTGLTANRNGWYSNEFQRKDVVDFHGFDQYNLLPKEMQKAGYFTAFTGKWHLRPYPWACGFESVRRWMVGGAGPFLDPKLAEGRSREMKDMKGFTQTIFADDALIELKKKASGETTQPLFLWVAFTAPHGPFIPNPEPFQSMFDGKTAKELAPSTFHDNPAKTKKGQQTWENYYEAMAALDAEVGRIMYTVKGTSLADNTVVVFMGDNGFMMGERDMHGKYVPYESSMRVPMIAWGPEYIIGTKGTTVTAAMNSIDLPPTFVRIAGGTPPADWTGRDATAVLKDGQVHDFTYAVSAYPDHDSLIDHANAHRVIRTPQYKLIEWHPAHDMEPEFYDLTEDPGEKNNLFGKPEVADAQAKLKAQLEEYRERTGDDQWDMKGPLGMHEPERLKWNYDEGPKKSKQGQEQAAPAELPAKKPKAERRQNRKNRQNKAVNQ